MKKSKTFRVAREGATTDGRKISREWITQMAANYDPKVYGARINLEHIKGLHPDSTFRAYGDVVSLSTEEEKGKLYLLAELSPTDDLIALNKKRQKVYSSIEVNPSFSDTGEAYLMGVAATDDPASLGTEMMEFSSRAKVNPLSSRKSNPDNIFTAVDNEFVLDFSDIGDNDDKTSLLNTVKTFFSKHRKFSDSQMESFRADLEETLELMVENFNKNDSPSVREFNTLKKAHDDLHIELTTLKTKLDNTSSRQNHRSTATGNSGNIEQTDC